MSKRKYSVFTAAESTPNCCTATPPTQPSTDVNDDIAEHRADPSPHLPALIQEGPVHSAEAGFYCPRGNWAEDHPNGPSSVTEATRAEPPPNVNWNWSEEEDCASAEEGSNDVDLGMAETPTGEEAPSVTTGISQEAAAEWFWTLLSQSGYKRW